MNPPRVLFTVYCQINKSNPLPQGGKRGGEKTLSFFFFLLIISILKRLHTPAEGIMGGMGGEHGRRETDV
jgi:hypothetical protein